MKPCSWFLANPTLLVLQRVDGFQLKQDLHQAYIVRDFVGRKSTFSWPWPVKGLVSTRDKGTMSSFFSESLLKWKSIFSLSALYIRPYHWPTFPELAGFDPFQMSSSPRIPETRSHLFINRYFPGFERPVQYRLQLCLFYTRLKDSYYEWRRESNLYLVAYRGQSTFISSYSILLHDENFMSVFLKSV